MKRRTHNMILLVALLTAGCGDASSPNAAAPGESGKRAETTLLAKTEPTAAAAPNPAQAPPADAGSTPSQNAQPPHLSFENTEHYFGSISEVQPVNASFKFTNTGGQTLVIDKIKTSCGCTTAALDKMEYQPGESGNIQVTFTPAGPGNETKLINVFSNSQPQPEGFARLTIHADIQPFISIEPRIVELGIVPYRQLRQFTVTVTCPNDPDFVIRTITATNKSVKAHERPPAPHQKERIIDCVVEADADWGALFSWLQITATAKPGPNAQPITHTSEIRVQGQIFGELRAEPDTFRFGAKPGEQFTRSVQLRRHSGEEYELLSASVKDFVIPNATVSVTRLAPNNYQLNLTATGDQLRTLALGKVLVKTNVPGEEEIEVPIVGVVRTEDPSVH